MNLLYWKLAIYRLLNGCLLVAGTAYIGATAAVNWSDMHTNEKVIIFITVGMAIGKYIEGFFDTTVPRLLAGKPPVPVNGNGDTQLLPKPVETKTENT